MGKIKEEKVKITCKKKRKKEDFNKLIFSNFSRQRKTKIK